MKKQILNISALVLASVLLNSCSQNKSEAWQEEQIFKILDKNPQRLLTVIEGAVKTAKIKQQEQQQLAEKDAIKAAIKTPLQPQISEKHLVRGPLDAPITIVEYSDFECPYCFQSKKTMEALANKYPGKIRFVFKHLPLSFHPQAMIAAKYYEAISLQSPKKAFEFHDKIFTNQSALKRGEAYLTELAENLNIDMIRLNRDLHSQIIQEKIQQDIAEADKFNFRGTPGFLINGVPVKGAYPLQHFEDIITQLQKSGSLVL